jgi:hypothetical protein
MEEEKAEKEEKKPQYKLPEINVTFAVVFAIFFLIICNAIAPAYVQKIPLIGPYMQVITSFYESGVYILLGQASMFIYFKFILSGALVILPICLIAMVVYIVKSTVAWVKFIIPLILVLVVTFIITYIFKAMT